MIPSVCRGTGQLLAAGSPAPAPSPASAGDGGFAGDLNIALERPESLAVGAR